MRHMTGSDHFGGDICLTQGLMPLTRLVEHIIYGDGALVFGLLSPVPLIFLVVMTHLCHYIFINLIRA